MRGGVWVPLLYLAWSRLCEYSAGRCGQASAGDLHAYERALAMPATGWQLARHVQTELLMQQANEAQGNVYARLIEITSTHPPLVKRTAELRQFVSGAPQITAQRGDHAGRSDALALRRVSGGWLGRCDG